MRRIILVCIALVAHSLAINSIKEYVDFIGKLALDESIIAEQTDFLDRRDRLLDEKMATNHLGAPQFTCPTMGARSASVPDSVHTVRLNDLAAMGAMGDSFTAGFGAGAHSLLELALDYRGLAFSAGGDSDLKYQATLPNLVNQFSPNMVGVSTRVAPAWFEYFSNFNVAVSGAKSNNMKEQAKELIRRMKASEHFKADDEYKLVNIFVGSNDLCHSCEDSSMVTADEYKRNLKEAIDMLHAELPKTIVNLIAPAHIELMQMMDKQSPYCERMHKVACPCSSANSDTMINLVKEYQAALHQLAQSYDGRDDFAVVVQTFTEKQELPFDNTGAPDYAFFAPDCSHFSHWGHSMLAKALFNNMLEPVGQKATKYDLATIEPQCPDQACPYIRTNVNSESAQCKSLTKNAPPLINGPVSFKKNMPQESILAANDPNLTNSPYIPVMVKDPGSNMALVLVGLALGLIFGLIIGTVTWQILQIKRNDRTIYVTENTPLLTTRPQKYNSEDNQYVQIY